MSASLLATACIAVRLAAQGPPPNPPGAQGPGAPPQGPGGQIFPAQQRPPGDPEVIKKGKGHYDIYCRACHGADLRGGDQGGPNLLRSQIVLNDQDGESIMPVIQDGRMNPGMPIMPPMSMPADEGKAIATYVRSVLATASRQGGPPPGEPIQLNIVVGDPKAGQAYFAAKCSTCHSAAAMQGIATRVSDPMQLQNHWVGGGGAFGRGGRGAGAAPTPVSVTVTDPSGQKVEGRLGRIDDFIVVVIQADGSSRSFRRDGDVPRVDVKDPRDAHRSLLPTYSDKDIHDVTAFLVTLK